MLIFLDRFMPNKKFVKLCLFSIYIKSVLLHFDEFSNFFFYNLIMNRLITNVKASPFFFSSLSFSLQMSHANRSLSLYITVLEQQEMTY